MNDEHELLDLTTERDWKRFRAGILVSLPSEVAHHILDSVQALRTKYEAILQAHGVTVASEQEGEE